MLQRYLFLFLLGLSAVPSLLIAEVPPKKTIDVFRTEPDGVQLDGRLDDQVWKSVRFVDDFLQKDPVENAEPSVRTEIGLAFDEEYLYVGARMWMEYPEEVSAIVTRRDNSGASDRIIISLDTYRDRRTAYSFSVTAAGVRTDYFHGSDNEGDRDYSFDPVWEARTWVGSTMWTAEMRIPFSQLRFNDMDVQEWGINVNRYIPNKSEDIYWVVIPRNGTGWSSRMGVLHGIEGIRPSGRLELLPYVAANARLPDEVPPGNPYLDDFNPDIRVGLDAKVGLGPNLTLDVAVNPDFGQVEADPAEVNLSVFETSFSERRPFFVEGAGLFSYNGPRHFYSRRIGSSPHGSSPHAYDFLDMPTSTTILGAAKLTGRLPGGLSMGGIAALTQREYARAYDEATGREYEFPVEPLTFYGAGRLQQEFGPDASTFGLIGTIVQRDLSPDDLLAERLPRLAITGGADWVLRLDGGDYQLEGNIATSHVQGSTEAIGRLQRSSSRYFQRPDADHVEFDSSRTSLTGFSGSLEFGKRTGHWVYSAGASIETPQYELNDIGLLNSVDDIAIEGDVTYRQDQQHGAVRNWSAGIDFSSGWNFGGTRQYITSLIDGKMNWTNFLTTYAGVGNSIKGLSDSKTRGGPLMDEVDVVVNGWTGMYNDFGSQVRWSWHVGTGLYQYDGWFLNTSVSVGMDLGDRLGISLSPWYYLELLPRQFVTKAPNGSVATYGTRYIFSELEFARTAMQVRLNFAVTPDLSLEFYAEPFVATGHYLSFGELRSAGTGDLEKYDGRISYDGERGEYEVTTDNEPVRFSDPDFFFRSFRSNLVLRWEWQPGSTFFLVWQQDRSGFEPGVHQASPVQWYDALTDIGDNFLALKLSYWFPVD